MQMPLELSCRGFQKTEPIDQLVNSEVDKLERVCDYMVSCRVALDMPHQQHVTGNSFRVRIDVRVPPGHEIVVKHAQTVADLHAEHARVIHEAFDIAGRRLRKLVEQQHGAVKSHPTHEVTGFVSKLFPGDDYGFIESLDGHDIYFHRNSVLNNDFARLEVGTGVRFVEESGEDGPQASTVQLVDKPGARRALAQSDAAQNRIGSAGPTQRA